MRSVGQWLLLLAALVQFGATALPPGNDDLISIHSLAYDLSRGDTSLLYPGVNFVRNDQWIAHHEANLRRLGDRGQPNWCFYPPLVPYVMIPWAAASDRTWRLIWGAIQLGLVVVFALLIERLLKSAGSPANRVLILALVIGSFPVARSVELGQTSLLMALFIWCAVYIAHTGQRFGAILLAGVAIFVKPFLMVIAIVDAARQRWWNAAGYVAVWLALLAISVFAVGLHAHQEYWNLLATLGSSQTAFYGNQSFFGGLFRVFSDLAVKDYGFWSDPTLAWVGRFVAVIILCLAGWAQFKARAAEPILSYGLWLSAAALALPISWEHHLVFVLPALAFLWTLPKTRAEAIILVIITALLELRWTFLYGEDLPGRLAANLPLFGNLLLFVYLVSYHLRSSAESLAGNAREMNVRA